MPRGGARLNAGAKPKWKNGKTKTIRVPEALLPQILEYAQKLDSCEVLNPISTQPIVLRLSGISIHCINGRSCVFIEDLIKSGYEIRPFKLYATVLDEMRAFGMK